MAYLLKHIENKTLFIETLKTLEHVYGIKHEWLMKVMYFESRINPKAKNKISGALGLIQFMPSTIKNLGYTEEQAKDPSCQLSMMGKYFEPYRNIKSFYDCYFAVFFPLAIGKKGDFVLQAKNLTASKIAEQNKAFDANSDKQITRNEVCDYLDKFFQKSAHNHNFNFDKDAK